MCWRFWGILSYRANKQQLEILNIIVCTWFGLSLDYKHLDDSIVADSVCFVGLASVDVDQFDFTILSAQKN